TIEFYPLSFLSSRSDKARRLDATYSKPTNQGVNQLKYQHSLKLTAMQLINIKYFEVILVDLNHKVIYRDPKIN
ncbi:9841_t:CDS:2, partial [Diversispora eburnea]